MFDKLAKFELSTPPKPEVLKPFERIQEHLKFIADKKTMKMFNKVEMVYQEGAASFVNANTVKVGEKEYTAKRIFICTGTSPSIPDIKGIEDIEYLTNENIFSLKKVPQSMIVVGGGAIACEMAQAFCRLGTEVTMVVRGIGLMWREYQGMTQILEDSLTREGVKILRENKPEKIEKVENGVKVTTNKEVEITAEKILLASGRAYNFAELNLESAGVTLGKKGEIIVNKYLQTNTANIYACGDCNGYRQFSHAAMHQGMIALMNSMSPWPFKQNFKKFSVPWTVFTEPQISQVGPRESELKEKGVKYEAVEVKYEDYGAAIAENVDEGFVRALVGPTGKIYSATIVGEGSGEMINEWALAVQKKLRITDIMFLQHSFPTMGFLTKRVSETWMMGKMKNEWLKKICRFMFKL
jgi:pyruvate/2-oxoglutarate dehydrogenase complex dihydrolipoamide dehydrogenase (E3) component